MLPYQRSGFANILCMPIVKDVCKEYKIEWKPSKNFILERIPSLYKFYLWAPMRRNGEVIDENLSVFDEIFDLTNAVYMVKFVLLGFSGLGAL